jgi:hypothetical protein
MSCWPSYLSYGSGHLALTLMHCSQTQTHRGSGREDAVHQPQWRSCDNAGSFQDVSAGGPRKSGAHGSNAVLSSSQPSGLVCSQLTSASSNQVDEREQRQWCSANFVNGRALRKAIDIHAQLSAQLASDQTMTTVSAAAANGDAKHSGAALQDARDGSADAEATAGLRRALTAGLAVHGAMRQPDGEVLASSSQSELVHEDCVGCLQLVHMPAHG